MQFSKWQMFLRVDGSLLWKDLVIRIIYEQMRWVVWMFAASVKGVVGMQLRAGRECFRFLLLIIIDVCRFWINTFQSAFVVEALSYSLAELNLGYED